MKFGVLCRKILKEGVEASDKTVVVKGGMALGGWTSNVYDEAMPLKKIKELDRNERIPGSIATISLQLIDESFGALKEHIRKRLGREIDKHWDIANIPNILRSKHFIHVDNVKSPKIIHIHFMTLYPTSNIYTKSKYSTASMLDIALCYNVIDSSYYDNNDLSKQQAVSSSSTVKLDGDIVTSTPNYNPKVYTRVTPYSIKLEDLKELAQNEAVNSMMKGSDLSDLYDF